jgi:signal transduction histidine kinase
MKNHNTVFIIILVSGITLSGVLTWIDYNNQYERQLQINHELSLDLTELIEMKLLRLVETVYAQRAFVENSEFVSPVEWTQLSSSLELTERFSNDVTISMVDVIDSKNTVEYEFELRKYISDFSVQSPTLGTNYIIKYISPNADNSLDFLIGLSLTEQNRQECQINAIESSGAVISNPIMLYEDDKTGKTIYASLICLKTFRENPPPMVSQTGLVNLSFHWENLADGVPISDDVFVEIYSEKFGKEPFVILGDYHLDDDDSINFTHSEFQNLFVAGNNFRMVIHMPIQLDPSAFVFLFLIGSGISVLVGIVFRNLLLKNSLINSRNEILVENKRRDDIKREYLEFVNKKKSEFATVIAHEIRTPVTTFTFNIKMLQNYLKDSTDNVKTILNDLEEESKKLSFMINDFFEAEKLDLGQFQIRKITSSLSSLIESVNSEINALAKSNEIDIMYNYDDFSFKFDAQKITQVIVNLIRNSLDFSPKNSTITIDVSQKNGNALFSVTDQGSGIPELIKSQIFKKFYSVDSSDTRKGTGTGLGLAICREIVESHGGKIWIDDTQTGAKISFSIPLE